MDCCVRFGYRENPSSQPLLLAALRSEAALAQLDCCSGVRLRRMLETFIHSFARTVSQLKHAG